MLGSIGDHMSERLETAVDVEETMSLPLTQEQLNILSDSELVKIAYDSFCRIVRQYGPDVESGFAVSRIETETGVDGDCARLVVGANRNSHP